LSEIGWTRSQTTRWWTYIHTSKLRSIWRPSSRRKDQKVIEFGREKLKLQAHITTNFNQTHHYSHFAIPKHQRRANQSV
jgi:hypothetical protein